MGITVETHSLDPAAPDAGLPEGDIAGVVLQYPACSGAVRDPEPVILAAKERGATAIVAADSSALTLLKPPGEMGADVVVGTTQRFGVPLGFGGPHAGYIAVRTGLERQLPGRLLVFRWMLTTPRRIAWRCRHASSTFGRRRPRATSAQRRCYLP